MKKSLKDHVWQRANRQCEYCRVPQDCEPDLPFFCLSINLPQRVALRDALIAEDVFPPA